MSVGNRLLEATKGLGDSLPQPAERTGPKTAPGALMAFRHESLSYEQRIETLEAMLAAKADALPVRSLDPQAIRLSKFANRMEASFHTEAHLELKATIEAMGGNSQPIGVRAAEKVDNTEWELIWGSRRHRCCIELGMPVKAMVLDLSDVDLFLAMDAENRSREDLSTYEMARHYRRALDEKLYPSAKQLAAALGVSQPYVAKILPLSEIPEEVVAAFREPSELSYRNGALIAAVLKGNRTRLLATAQRLAGLTPRLPAAAVMRELLGTPISALARRVMREIDGRSVTLASIRENSNGVAVMIPKAVLLGVDRSALFDAIEQGILSGFGDQ
jgi:ParB family chromosome partitioning protein